MREALAGGDAARVERVLGEIDAGVRESYGDVRELLAALPHPRQRRGHRAGAATTLRKFEHQSGIADRGWRCRATGMPLPPDVQIQVLHIVQEALSNVRKHARAHAGLARRAAAAAVALRGARRRRRLLPDGAAGRAETHVGLRIMTERAERIGATLEVLSTPGRGTSVVLELPAMPLRPRPHRCTVPRPRCRPDDAAAH